MCLFLSSVFFLYLHARKRKKQKNRTERERKPSDNDQNLFSSLSISMLNNDKEEKNETMSFKKTEKNIFFNNKFRFRHCRKKNMYTYKRQRMRSKKREEEENRVFFLKTSMITRRNGDEVLAHMRVN